MNGAHDMGGMHGFGPVVREENEPVFHEDWEKTVFMLSRATRVQGIINIDESRHGIERMPPAEYLAASYYERWLSSLERVLVEKGVITQQELDARTALLREQPDAPLPHRENPEIIALLTAPSSARDQYQREGPAPQFAEGDAVLTLNEHPVGHTRLPRYVRGKRGTIHAVRGSFVFPDTHAHGLGEQPQPMYTVMFEGAELWGPSSEPRERVYIDLWESYLLPAPAV
ncbi:MAG: nitrile hydratase subunit beta [Chloroflexota bacterium]